MRLIRAWNTLVVLSFRRLFWSANTLMVMLPLVICGLFILRRHFDRMDDAEAAFRGYSDFVMFVFGSFIVPICALAFGTASVGGDREDRTLTFLLIRPVPRVLILVAKFVAALPLVFGFVVVSFSIYCRFAGGPGAAAWHAYLPIILLMTLAYVSLFQLFAVCFRYATIVALIYSLFMELILGNLPGIIKRTAVNYYGRSMIYAAGASEGLSVPDWFQVMTSEQAARVLFGISIASWILSAAIFQWREYRDVA